MKSSGAADVRGLHVGVEAGRFCVNGRNGCCDRDGPYEIYRLAVSLLKSASIPGALVSLPE